MRGPRFDRIVPLVTLVLAGLGVVFLLELNTQLLVVNIGENFPSFSVAWALIGVLAFVTGIGVELIARVHPQIYTSGWMATLSFGQRQLELALPLWIVPSLTPIAMFAFFRLFKGGLQTNAYLLVLVATAVLLLLVLTAQHYLLDDSAHTRKIARDVQSIVAYVLIFAIFSVITFNRYRTLYALMLVFPSTLLLAADLLRNRVPALWLTASGIALVLIESYWALNYWPASFWLNSAALLVIFYVLVGLVQGATESASDDRAPGQLGLTRRLLLEYGMVGSGALIALAIATAILRAQNIDLRGP
jgi:hypothetical protein